MKKDRFEELSEVWFDKAVNDYLWAKDSFKSAHYGATCFVCQQVAEKALKAYLFFKKEKLVRTHDLERLLEKAEVYNERFQKLRPDSQILNNYYTDTRYPDIWDYTRFENKSLAKEALESVKEILDFVEDNIKNG